jgi:hypothetical protein
MVYCSFILNVWMYVCLRSYRERSGWRAQGTRRRSPWAAAGWWRKVSLDLSLSYTFLNSLSIFTQFIPKDWLAFVIHVVVYLFGLDYYYLALCYCSTLINEHDEIYQWYVVSLLYYDVILVAFTGARAVSRVPLRKDMFVGWPPGKTLQPWGWSGTLLAE